MIQAVLFDLDGTFADTAADLSYALNAMRNARGLSPVSLESTRPVTSHGARGLLGVGFSLTPEHADYLTMRTEFLNIYEQNLCRATVLFPGMSELVDELEARRCKWGIVTNKAERFALPLMKRLRPASRCGCVIGGDTVARMKPHPDPLFAAARALEVAPETCIYVGDDSRDIQAGRTAGMRTIAVRYGYLNGSQPDSWGADAVIDHPQDVLRYLV